MPSRTVPRDRRVRVRRGGRRCCAGCSPSTSLRVRAAAAGGGSWECTPGASRCGPCSSGWASGAPRRRRSRRGRRRARRSNRTGSTSPRPGTERSPASVSAGVRALAAFGRSPRGPGGRRSSASEQGLALPAALDVGRRGRDRGARRGAGQGVATAKGRFEFLAARAMPRSTSPIPRHEFSHKRRAPSTGISAFTRAASSVTRSSRPRRSVTGRGLAGQHALFDHVVRPH
jgi:hypothetical protein